MIRMIARAAAAAMIAALSLPAADITRSFLARNCASCHNAETRAGSLDLAALPLEDAGTAELTRWARVLERVRDAEMPPRGSPQPDASSKRKFLASLEKSLERITARRHAQTGRVAARRLNRVEYENTVHDLLGIDIPLKDFLPEDPRTSGFDTVASGQQISHFLLENYLNAADAALDAAFARALEPPNTYRREFTPKQLARKNQREPDLRGYDVVVFSTPLVFVGRMPPTKAPESGWYRIRVRVAAVNPPPEGYVWAMLRSGVCYARAPLMFWIGSMRATPEPQDFEFTAWIEQGHMLELRPGDKTIKSIPYRPILEEGAVAGERAGIPGISIQGLEMERVYKGASPDRMKQLLFGDLLVSGNTVPSGATDRDVRRLVAAFASRAFRRPVEQEEVGAYVNLVSTALENGKGFAEALRGGYRALLCSPQFLYLQEKPGRLDDYAIASRLSYFLWSSMPDEALLSEAAKGRLKQRTVLRAQVERILNHARSRAFIENFTGQWLNLRNIDFTSPDPVLYPEFDEILKHAMLDETRLFFEDLLRRDASVHHIVDSDFAFLNSRLARHYGIDGVKGGGMERVPLPPDSVRGGLLTQGAILKVTANGTTSSPVVRGAWVLERIMGQTVPPPPANVPAVEPDIRGAKTIREQLARHRDTTACAACHYKIDPPGFALEAFDPVGALRDRYRVISGEGRNAARRWRPGPAVDSSYTMPDGKAFRDVRDFKRILLEHPEQLARGLAEQLMIYGTGAGITFADRPAIDAIVAGTRAKNFGVRSLVHAVVASPVFLSK